MNNEKVGKFLCELRQEKNLKQTDLAKLCNVTFQAVSQWETGKTLPDIEILKKLSEIYNITINEILEGAKFQTEESSFQADNEEAFKEIKSRISSKITISLVITVVTFILLIAGLVGRMIQFMILPAFIISLFHSLHYLLNNDEVIHNKKEMKLNNVVLIITAIFLMFSLIIFIVGITNESLTIFGFLQPFIYFIMALNLWNMKKSLVE